MPNRNPLSGRAGLHSITPLLHPKLHTISHRGRPYARYLDFTAPLLVALTASPSRLLDCFATAWALSTPDERKQIARSALTPRFLCPDVARRAFAMSTKRVTEIVDAGFETLRGLVLVDKFLDPDSGELRQALTLRGLDGINAFLVLVARQAQPLRGLYRGCIFVKRVAPMIAQRQSDEAVNDLVSKIDAACSARLQRAA